MVSASDLFELGLQLMKTCTEASTQVYRATRYRDGLLIALLISCPMRLTNFAGLVIGRHLVFDGQGYEIRLGAEETKTRRPYHAAVPTELTERVDRWLGTYRTQMLAANHAVNHCLWLGRWGRPMTSAAIRHQLKSRTRDAFGKAVWPHLFRDCAVTELVDSAPEEIGIAADLLGHTDLGTTRKHYI
jgi:integrase/recombinase XerD